MQEIWKDIPNYENLYQISNLGNVKSYSNSKVLKTSPNSCGYYKVQLYKNKKSKMFYVHRLVAIAFIPNLENKSQINHIDGNKSNNVVSNLEWCTASENQLHAIKHNLRKSSPMLGRKGALSPRSKKIMQYDKNGNFIKEWDSISDASKAFGIKASCISNNLCKRTKSSKGFIWDYLEK